ncbi:MAG: polyisoprenoid-binding protein [Proteobacteria bacterium]|nr:MAG: polyisoprenoid-binding protein [Pseudomonadota bacterium]
MKNFRNAALVTFALLASSAGLAANLSVDPAHSSITFEAIHLKVSKIPGKFTDFSGNIDLDEKDFTKSKINFTVKVASITTAVDKRDEHLRSPDFFDAAKFPTATFKSSSIKGSGKDFTVDGDLTIRGVTKKASFKVAALGKVQDPAMKAEKNVFQATGTINRKDFGVNYGPDEIVSDKINLAINLEAVAEAKAK